MKTNRLISREEAQALDLDSRIELEAQVTDAKLEIAKPKPIPEDWSFAQFSTKISTLSHNRHIRVIIWFLLALVASGTQVLAADQPALPRFGATIAATVHYVRQET